MPLQPRFNIRDRELTTAFRRVVELLQGDADLKKLRPDWRIPEDSDFDEKPAEGRVTIRITPETRNAERFNIIGPGANSSQVALALRFEITTPKYWVDNANLWQAIEAVFFKPDDPTARQAVQADLAEHHVSDLETTRPAIGLKPGDVAEGEMMATVYVYA